MVEVAPDRNGWDTGNGASWLAEAQEEYHSVMTSLYSLGSQLAALQAAMERSSPTGLRPSPSSPSSARADGLFAPDVAPMQPFLLQTIAGPVEQESARLERGMEENRTIRVSLLGPFQLFVGGRNLGPAIPRQVRTVLEYLVSQGRRPTSKDAILDLLWPDTSPSIASSRLRVVMHTLRKNIPCSPLGFQDLVVMTGNNFMVNPDATLRVDVEEFERHWLAAWRLAKAGRTYDALAEYEQAEALYTGDYLEDEPYADWTLLRREALRDAYANVLTMLATMSVESGDYTGAVIWSQKLLAQDNCREDAYRLLITSHQRLGQPGRAAQWYKLCAWMLQRELGLEPSAETQALQSQLIAAGGEQVDLRHEARGQLTPN